MLGLAACATSGEPRPVSWRASGLPPRFDYDCELGAGHERFSVDLEANRWADDRTGVQPIVRVEAERVVFEDGLVGSNTDLRTVDIASGAYLRELHVADPALTVTLRGACSVTRFTPFARRIDAAVRDVMDRYGIPEREARPMVETDVRPR